MNFLNDDTRETKISVSEKEILLNLKRLFPADDYYYTDISNIKQFKKENSKNELLFTAYKNKKSKKINICGNFIF
jgi:hypothetical protein